LQKGGKKGGGDDFTHWGEGGDGNENEDLLGGGFVSGELNERKVPPMKGHAVARSFSRKPRRTIESRRS